MSDKEQIERSKLRSYEQMSAVYVSLEEQGKENLPYILEYQTENQELVFFGSVHSADPEHAQTRLLDEKWQEFVDYDKSPKHVFSEGSLRSIDDKDKEQAIRSDAESGHICWLAAKDGIVITSPEPDREKEIEHLHDRGFSYEEIINYYFARQMLQWIIYDHQNEPDWRKYAGNIRLYKSVHDFGGLDLGLDPVSKIFKEQTGKEFSVDDKELLYELSDPSQNVVSAASGRYRDEVLYDAIKGRLQKGYSLFVVYGSGHAIVLEPALVVLVKGKND